jgi:hypothetical protein
MAWMYLKTGLRQYGLRNSPHKLDVAALLAAFDEPRCL